MSPGRCDLPSTLFSTIPIAPTTLTLALRAASACIRPTTQAAPAIRHRLARRVGLPNRRQVGDRDRDVDVRGLLLPLLALGLVAVERIGPQPHSERQLRQRIGLGRPAWQIG